MYEGVRLAEILDKSTSCLRHWLWIPGQLNPADWITRTTLSAGRSSLRLTRAESIGHTHSKVTIVNRLSEIHKI